MRKARRRLLIASSVGGVLALAAVLFIIGLQSQVAFFRTPSQLAEEGFEPGRAVRVGGLVTVGSVRSSEGAILFELTDDESAIEVAFSGVLPSLFREGQCVIAEGSLDGRGGFSATRVMAKHDEEYRAPEISEAPRLARSCGPDGGAEPATS